MAERKNPWVTKNKKVIYDNPWIHVEEHDVLNPAGNPAIYGVISFYHYAIGIVAIDEAHNIWLIGQHRYPFNSYTWEIPEGGGKRSEDPLWNAQRELREEAGLEADHWEMIQEIQVSNSVTDEVGFIYLARGLHLVDPDPDEDEELEIRKLPFAEAYAMLERGEIVDSLTVVALLKTKILLDL
ncbi:MAG: NUDIX hydrolase [Chitinophagales bacterium]